MKLLYHRDSNYGIQATLADLLALLEAGFTINGQEGDEYGPARSVEELRVRDERVWKLYDFRARVIEWGSPYVLWNRELAGVISVPMGKVRDTGYFGYYTISLHWTHGDGSSRPLTEGALKLIEMAQEE